MPNPTVRNPQLGSALALTQLLTEHPDLPVATWSIGPVLGVLHGHLHEESFAPVRAYLQVLGGTIHGAKQNRRVGDHEVRTHWLDATWRDVPVQVTFTLPVASSLPVPPEGLLADQRLDEPADLVHPAAAVKAVA
ncbi:MAG TPA: hypothetical protein VFH77_05185 [Streptomyces sp.]|nr:hypothetical protein [Streptomyces sp.]